MNEEGEEFSEQDKEEIDLLEAMENEVCCPNKERQTWEETSESE